MIYVVVELEVRDWKAFKLFETLAFKIMQKHNGQLVKAFEPESSCSTPTSTDEVHVLLFKSLDDFDRYRTDEDLVNLANLRDKAIAATKVFVQGIEKVYG